MKTEIFNSTRTKIEQVRVLSKENLEQCKGDVARFILCPAINYSNFSALKQLTSFYEEIPKIKSQHDNYKMANAKNFRDLDTKFIQLERTISINNQSISTIRNQRRFAFQRVIDCDGTDDRCLESMLLSVIYFQKTIF